MRYFFYIIITLFWLTMSALYIQKEFAPLSVKNTPEFVQFHEGKIRLRIEQNGKPIGFVENVYLPQANHTCMVYNRVQYLFQSGSFMMMAMPQMKFNAYSFILLGRDGKPLDFNSKVVVEGFGVKKEIFLQGGKKETGYEILITAEGQKVTHTMKEFPILPGNSPFSTRDKLEVGREWASYEKTTGMTYLIYVKEKGTYLFEGKKEPAYFLESRLKNSPSEPSTAWVDEYGEIFRADFSGGRALIRESIKKEKINFKTIQSELK